MDQEFILMREPFVALEVARVELVCSKEKSATQVSSIKNLKRNLQIKMRHYSEILNRAMRKLHKRKDKSEGDEISRCAQSFVVNVEQDAKSKFSSLEIKRAKTENNISSADTMERRKSDFPLNEINQYKFNPPVAQILCQAGVNMTAVSAMDQSESNLDPASAEGRKKLCFSYTGAKGLNAEFMPYRIKKPPDRQFKKTSIFGFKRRAELHIWVIIISSSRQNRL